VIPRLRFVTTPQAAEAGELDAADEQARAEARLRLRRGRIATAVVAGVLALIVALVALLGGFHERTDLLTPVAPGSVISTGPYEVTLDKAGVRQVTSSGKWEVVVTGTARTTGATSIAPGTDQSGFVFARAASGEVQPSQSFTLSGTSPTQHLDHLTPGLPPVPWSVSFTFDREPTGTVVLGVFDQEYTTPYLFSKERGWRPTRSASTFTLPLDRLPDETF
jgi:hypothetical protein